MSNNGKNLEAENELFKGVFRTPLAIMFGGLIGFLYNAIYTGARVNYEINREINHKEYLKSLGIDGETDICKKGREKRVAEEKQIAINKHNTFLYLMREFEDGDDYSFDEGCRIQYRCKERFTHANKHYTAIIHIGYGIDKMWGGQYLPEDEFIKKYEYDLANGNVKQKYKFMNNKVRGAFGYKTEDGFWFTGMFTTVE